MAPFGCVEFDFDFERKTIAYWPLFSPTALISIGADWFNLRQLNGQPVSCHAVDAPVCVDSYQPYCLFLTMLIDVSFGSIFCMVICMGCMGTRRMSMVCRLLMIAGFVMFGGFRVMLRCMSMMLSGLLVMIGCFF